MKHSDSITHIAPAMLRAKALISALPLVKDKRGDKAKYIELATINAALEPIILGEGCLHLQGTTDKITDGVLVAITAETVLLHAESGEWWANEVVIPVSGPILKGGEHRGPVGAQDGGISLTYARRYGIAAFWNLTFDDDTDGAAKNQGRRKRARELAEDVVTKTAERTEELRKKLEAKKRPPKLVGSDEGCRDCGQPTGTPHDPECPNA